MAVAVAAGLLAPLAATGPLAGSAAAASSPPALVSATVSCPGLGSVTLALPGGVASPALPPGVELAVGFQAHDARSGATVSGGDPPGQIACATVPFADQPARGVVAAALPRGVAPADRLSGAWAVSVTVAPAPETAPSVEAPSVEAPSVEAPSVEAPPPSIVENVESYLATRSGSASVAVYDATTGDTLSVAAQRSYVTASIVKVDILMTLLDQAQEARRTLSAEEQATASQMIEFSDNNAATALWNEVGRGPAVAAFNRQVPMPNTFPGSDGLWGLTMTTAPDQVALVRDLAYPDSPLGSSQRAYELNLMEHVTPSQAWGVSGGVPGGVTVALKNGWLPVSGGWEINSVGHVAGNGQDYVIAVLTSGDPSMGYGISTIEGVSSLVWAGLSARPAAPARPAVGRKADGSLEVFATTSEGRLLTSWQAGPAAPLGGWLDMGLPDRADGVPAVVTEHNGGLQAFVRTTDYRLLTTWEAGPSAAFGGWLDLGLVHGTLGDPAAGITSSGAISIVVAAAPGRVLTSWQPGPDQPFGGWLDLAAPDTVTGVPAVVRDRNGGLQVFARTADHRLLTSWQRGPTSPFGGWLDLGLDGAVLGDPSVATTSTGAMSLAVASSGGSVVTSWQSVPDGPFGGWLNLGLPASVVGVPALATEAGGGLQVFASTSDGRLLTAWQGGPTTPFGGWLDLGSDGSIGSDPGVGGGQNGVLAVFVRSRSGDTLVDVQSGPDQPFNGFADLDMPH